MCSKLFSHQLFDKNRCKLSFGLFVAGLCVIIVPRKRTYGIYRNVFSFILTCNGFAFRVISCEQKRRWTLRHEKCDFCRDAQITTNIYILHDIDFLLEPSTQAHHKLIIFNYKLDRYLRSAIAIDFFVAPAILKNRM